MKRIMGIDYGEKRIGLAQCDAGGLMAFPVRTIECRGDADGLEQVARACKEADAERVIVGVPINMNGTRGPMAERATAFAARLQETTGLPVETCDERLSTAQVERSLLAADMSRARRKEVRDKLAAQVILQSWLDRRDAMRCVSDGSGGTPDEAGEGTDSAN